ncbi:MAG: HAMP domain-containing histidine kinase [Flavobacteriales bacterium]|nr:HAMP domain-containing histidine kinase [Flavobacteriales bacterium]
MIKVNIKSRYWMLIVPMVVALIGITVIQVAWMRKAYLAKEETFDHQVQGALADAVARLQSEEAIRFIAGHSSEETESPVLRDSILRMTEWVIGQNEGDAGATVDVNVELIHDALDSGKHQVIRTVKKNGGRVIVEERVTASPSEDNLEHVVKKMVKEYSMRDASLKTRLGNTDMKRLLKQCLNDQGLELDFNFHITGMPSEKSADSLSGEYQIRLFKDDLVDKPGTLHVSFPGRENFLHASLYSMAGLSIFFTLVMIFTFLSTLYHMHRQKKLADMKSDFINGMTHELKTPIATIGLAAEALNHPRVAGQDEQVKQYATIIRKENQRMNRQVENVLHSTLADREEMQLRMEVVNLNEIIDVAVEDTWSQMDMAQGTFSVHLNATESIINGDTVHLRQMVLNLIDNAIKYAGERPEVVVETTSGNGFVQLSVRDNGPGIPEEELERIFDKFYRVGKGNAYTVKGFGIGLYYVKTIAKKHRGSVQVESRSGQGSTFIIKLPLCHETT